MDQETQVSPEAIEADVAPPTVQHADDQEAEQEHAKPPHDQAAPADVEHDREAKPNKGTSNTAVNLSLGSQVGADGKRLGPPADKKEGKVADAAHVTILAGSGSELELGGGAVPREDELFTRAPTGGTAVTQRSGSVATPNITPTMQPDNLFIGGTPEPGDIRQGGIGDCFFMSCMLGMSQNDPGKLKSVMSISGGSVNVTFQRLDAASGTYKHVTMHETTSLMTRKDKKGHVSLVGAGLKIADNPLRSQWWAEVHGKTVEVHRRDVYETALWAPMMEKAYADFTKQHGNDGHGAQAADKNKTGYQIIHQGGAVEDCYQLFYGAAATANTTAMSFTPGQDVVAPNLGAIADLLRYQTTKGNTKAGQSQTFMHARMSDTGAVTRGRDLIDLCTSLLNFEQLGDDLTGIFATETITQEIERLLRKIDRNLLKSSMATLRTTLVNFLATPPTAKADDVAKAADPVSTPDLFPHLWDDKMPAPFKQLRENLGILINLGDDSSPGRRQNYTSHAYEVANVALADHSGKPLTIGPGDVPAHAADIDAEKSQILMRNPHATNEPDLKGTGPEDKVDDGQFTYTLDQFLRNFDLLRMATVAH